MTIDETEIWRSVSDLPYQVSSFGRVRRLTATMGRTRSGKILAPQSSDGRPKVFLCHHGVIEEHRISKLVCEAFHGISPSPRHQAVHLDGDYTNNNAANIKWMTPAEKSSAMISRGATRRGGRCNLSKLDDDDAREIRNRHGTGSDIARLAYDYGVTRKTIRRVVNFETHRPFI